MWADDPAGGPLRTGTIDAERLENWVDDLYASGMLIDSAMQSHVGPDSAAIEFDFDLGDQQLRIVSWHETVDSSKVVALSQGIVALNSKTPEQLLGAEPPEYQRFIKNWALIRAGVREVLPREGSPIPEGTDIEAFLASNEKSL